MITAQTQKNKKLSMANLNNAPAPSFKEERGISTLFILSNPQELHFAIVDEPPSLMLQSDRLHWGLIASDVMIQL